MTSVNDQAADTIVEGGHNLLLELGQGGTAQVFLAVLAGAQGVNKLVVLKCLRPSFAGSHDLRQMFINEARLAARLNHANIVQTSAVLEMQSGPAIVMEYLEGQSFSSILSRARARMSLAMRVRIIVEALRGLHYAHELTDLNGEACNLVHRDISPQNVFVTYDGQIKLIDFGIAKLKGLGEDTATGVIKGKIRYMPPEQIEGVELDRRTDVYAAGVMLWEAATRERMWKGQSDANIMRRVLDGEMPKPRTVSPDVPEELEAIILKALSPRKEDRHATAAELETELEAFLDKCAPVTSRDIGKFVTHEFEEIRRETKHLIDLQLKRWAHSRSTSETTLTPQPPPALAHALSRAGYATATSDSKSISEPPPNRRLGAVVFAACALAIGVIGVRIGTQSRTQPAAAAMSAAPVTAAAPSASAAPPEADGAAPAYAATAETSAHAAASAPAGAEPPSTPRFGAAAGPRLRLPPTRATSASAASPPKPQKSNCQPPYTIDAEGNKHLKVECL
jgi:serine/threonine-protein kinase